MEIVPYLPLLEQDCRSSKVHLIFHRLGTIHVPLDFQSLVTVEDNCALCRSGNSLDLYVPLKLLQGGSASIFILR